MRDPKRVQSPKSSIVAPDNRLSAGMAKHSQQGGGSFPLEQDFTTPGVQGDLSCPLASRGSIPQSHHMAGKASVLSYERRYSLPTSSYVPRQSARGSMWGRNNDADVTSPPLSISGSTSKCPIRFLDQQSPEEIAKYFESHKHDIPRSHEICVKRYQSNSENIRQLDAKYGNLVNMIQGLGIKHQPLLPTKEEDGEAEVEHQSIERVQRWAASCSDNDADNEEAITQDSSADKITEQRTGHFDRPLKEIRVGESPSRPWGISVPLAATTALSEGLMQEDEPGPVSEPGISSESRQGHAITPNGSPSHPKECPFNPESSREAPGPFRNSGSHRTHSTKRKDFSDKTPSQRMSQEKPQMLFTGPVFIGYSAEDVKTLLGECFPGTSP